MKSLTTNDDLRLLDLLGNGLTIAESANKLHTSPICIQLQLQRLRKRFSVKTDFALAVAAISAGYIGTDRKTQNASDMLLVWIEAAIADSDEETINDINRLLADVEFKA